MTFFEQELRKIVGGICPTATYVGRACYVELNENNRAKIQFVAPRVYENYTALQVNILNQKEGNVDELRLNFADIWGTKRVSNPNFPKGVTPYAWTYDGKTSWYAYQPTQADYAVLQKNLLNYLKVYDYLKDRKPSLDAQIAGAAPGVGREASRDAQNKKKAPEGR